MRSGIKSTEFWLGLAISLAIGIQKYFWPDHPFPQEQFAVLITWIGSRLAEKTISATTTKRAWQTTEFWLTIGYSIVSYFVPGLPPELAVGVGLYTVGRGVSKGSGQRQVVGDK